MISTVVVAVAKVALGDTAIVAGTLALTTRALTIGYTRTPLYIVFTCSVHVLRVNDDTTV